MSLPRPSAWIRLAIVITSAGVLPTASAPATRSSSSAACFHRSTMSLSMSAGFSFGPNP